jgi:nicotinamidase-related amidase
VQGTIVCSKEQAARTYEGRYDYGAIHPDENRLDNGRAKRRGDSIAHYSFAGIVNLKTRFGKERKPMSQNNGRVKRTEKGLLTPDNCVVAFIDHQPQMLFGVSNFDRQSIINNVVAFAKATRIFDLPVVLSTVETKSFSGIMWPQLKAIFPDREPIERSSMNSWDDRNFVAAIEKTGKKKIVWSGLWTETCIALPTIQALHDGYEIYVVEDCCGDISQLSHDNAMRRVVQAGAKPVSSLSTMLEWQRDWANRDSYDAVMDVVKNHYGAYGMGVEYAYTMMHGAPPTVFPEYHVPKAEMAHK